MKPNILPKTVMEKITQNGDIPTVSPKIAGPITKPSNCCKQRINIVVHIAGTNPDDNNANNMIGIPPINGPK